MTDCLLGYEGPHSTVLLNDLVQPLRTSYEKLSKLKELVETTLDLKQAEMGEYIVRADFDDKLGG